MANFAFRGLEEYAMKLSKLEAGSQEIAGKAIYEGAKIVADEIKAGIMYIPVATNKAGSSEKKIDSITPGQRRGLIEGMGISPMRQDNGYWNVKVGFDGYNGVKTEKYPNGQPNVLIARSVESGTSFRKKRPFVRTAVNRVKNIAVQAMKDVVDKEIEKTMK